MIPGSYRYYPSLPDVNLKWYRRLVPSDSNCEQSRYRSRALLEDCPARSLLGKLVLAYETDDKKRIYCHLESHVDFYKLLKSLPPEKRRFHEIFMSEAHQKPRFDIDIKREEIPAGWEGDLDEFAQMVTDNLISSLIETLRKDNINLNLNKDIAVCTSHGPDKKSIHLILYRYTHGSSRESLAFYDLVVKNSQDPALLSRFVDRGVYSANQAFRTLWSRKVDSDRVKIFQPFFTYEGDEYQFPLSNFSHHNDDSFNISLLGITLVTLKIGCQMLPMYEREENLRSFSDISVENSDIEKALLSLYQHEKQDRFCVVDDIKGGLITLRRLRPSTCSLCQREHQSEHPYMYISSGQLFYHCRRAPRELRINLGPIRIETNKKREKTPPNAETNAHPEDTLPTWREERNCPPSEKTVNSIRPEKPSVYVPPRPAVEDCSKRSSLKPTTAKDIVSPECPCINHLKTLQDLRRAPKSSTRKKKFSVRTPIASYNNNREEEEEEGWIAGAPNTALYF